MIVGDGSLFNHQELIIHTNSSTKKHPAIPADQREKGSAMCASTRDCIVSQQFVTSSWQSTASLLAKNGLAEKLLREYWQPMKLSELVMLSCYDD